MSTRPSSPLTLLKTVCFFAAGVLSLAVAFGEVFDGHYWGSALYGLNGLSLLRLTRRWATSQAGQASPVEHQGVGMPLTTMSDRVKQLAPVNRIDAIRVYREETRAGLKEAKDAIDAFLEGRIC